MIASGYSLDLYCDAYKSFEDPCYRDAYSNGQSKAHYSSEYRAKCRALAKKDGWKIDYANGIAICKHCRRRSRGRG